MNLIIGSTSQLSHYFPKDYVRISSRNIDFDFLKSQNWESVYITFSEQRIYDSNIDYITPNYIYTLKIIESLLSNSNKIVCYSSCELWNDLSGKINAQTEPKFYPLNNEYTISKLLLLNKVKELRKIDRIYNKIIFIHPFYFNSIYRSKYFLFGKIFDSIINKNKINVGNLNFYRDMVHPKLIVQQSIDQTKDSMVGSGKLFNIKHFVKDLYEINYMKFDEFVNENLNFIQFKEKLIMAYIDDDREYNYTYENLLQDTQEDLQKAMEK